MLPGLAATARLAADALSILFNNELLSGQQQSDNNFKALYSKTGIIPRMATNDFYELQRQLEATASELKTANDPDRRRTLLREMSQLVAEAERISPTPKMSRQS